MFRRAEMDHARSASRFDTAGAERRGAELGTITQCVENAKSTTAFVADGQAPLTDEYHDPYTHAPFSSVWGTSSAREWMEQPSARVQQRNHAQSQASLLRQSAQSALRSRAHEKPVQRKCTELLDSLSRHRALVQSHAHWVANGARDFNSNEAEMVQQVQHVLPSGVGTDAGSGQGTRSGRDNVSVHSGLSSGTGLGSIASRSNMFSGDSSVPQRGGQSSTQYRAGRRGGSARKQGGRRPGAGTLSVRSSLRRSDSTLRRVAAVGSAPEIVRDADKIHPKNRNNSEYDYHLHRGMHMDLTMAACNPYRDAMKRTQFLQRTTPAARKLKSFTALVSTDFNTKRSGGDKAQLEQDMTIAFKRRWMSFDMRLEEVGGLLHVLAKPVNHTGPGHTDILRLHRILREHALENPNPLELSRSQFVRIVQNAIVGTERPSLTRLFSAFDPDNNGRIRYSRITNALLAGSQPGVAELLATLQSAHAQKAKNKQRAERRAKAAKERRHSQLGLYEEEEDSEEEKRPKIKSEAQLAAEREAKEDIMGEYALFHKPLAAAGLGNDDDGDENVELPLPSTVAEQKALVVLNAMHPLYQEMSGGASIEDLTEMLTTCAVQEEHLFRVQDLMQDVLRHEPELHRFQQFHGLPVDGRPRIQRDDLRMSKNQMVRFLCRHESLLAAFAEQLEVYHALLEKPAMYGASEFGSSEHYGTQRVKAGRESWLQQRAHRDYLQAIKDAEEGIDLAAAGRGGGALS